MGMTGPVAGKRTTETKKPATKGKPTKNDRVLTEEELDKVSGGIGHRDRGRIGHLHVPGVGRCRAARCLTRRHGKTH